MFTGDIAKFNPADLLMFLGHLDKEGVLTVTNAGQGLQVSFTKGSIVDAHSESIDERTLRTLLFHGLIDQKQFDYINGIRHETGLPLRQILEKIDRLSLAECVPYLEQGIKEVLFQLFSWEAGQFHFSEMPVDPQVHPCALSCERLTLDVVWQIDEYREILRSIDSIDRAPIATPAGKSAADPSPPQRFLLERANGTKSIRNLIDVAPFSTLEFAQALQTSLTQEWIELRANGAHNGNRLESGGGDEIFSSYKRSLRKIVVAADTRQKTTEVVNFCKEHFNYALVVASKDGQVVRCIAYARNTNGKFDSRDIRAAHVHTARDPIFEWVNRSKHPFIGKAFPSELLRALGQDVPNPEGECAVVPLGRMDDIDFLVYVATSRTSGEPGPFHYLELMSWHLNPPVTEPPPKPGPSVVAAPAAGNTPDQSAQPTPAPHDMIRLVASVKELPPLPTIVARTLNLLSNANSGISDLVEVLSHDPTMVARLIKVSNSALYSRGQKITTLSQTVARLGTRAVRSLVLAASTRSLFPMDSTNIGIWGQSLWQHSVECGLAANRVADIVGYGDPEEAFVAGVLHDIGKLVILLNLPDAFRAIRIAQTSQKQSSIQAETAELGFDHTMVGERLMEQWNMPLSLKTCVRHHHDPSEAGEFATLAYVVAYGNFLSHTCGAQSDESRAQHAVDVNAARAALNLSDEKLQVLQERIGEDFRHSDFLD